MHFLHVEDNPHDAELVESLIQREWPQCRVERVDTRAALDKALKESDPQLILSDFSLPSFDGLSALKLARELSPDTPFIFLSGTIGEEVAVEALKNGAIDYVLKDRMGRLIPAIQRALLQAEEQARRRRAEEALRETQERYRQITENVADLIAVFDLEGCRVYSNPAYQTLFGQQDEPDGAESFQDVHPEDRSRVRQSFLETVRTGAGRRSEFRFLLRDGGVRYIEAQSSVLRDAEGKVVNVLIVSRDVTLRKQAEERIREQASLLDKARDAICVVDLAEAVTYWNASAETLFGWSASEAVGQKIQRLLFSQDVFRYPDTIRDVLVEGRWMGELRPETKAGATVVVESRWTLVADASGRPQSILIINTDVTEKKRLEVQFLRAQRMESIGTLAGGIAHDLNNVLTPILVAAQVLQTHATKDDRPLLETIEKSALHGAGLVKQVLLFARGAEGEHAPLQVRHLIGEMEKLLRETLPRSIEIRTRLDRELWLVRGDATQLNQVLMNLCVNARDAMPNGGQIMIEARNRSAPDEFVSSHPELASGPYLTISVSDTGTGIPPDVIERIWDPFFTTKEIGKGTGLGLSTVMGIVKGHGGAVNVHSQLNKGTRFDIYLPAIPKEEEAEPQPSRSRFPTGQGEGILVIDDEPYIRDVVGSMLKYCGYRGYFAASGHKGIEVYQKHQDEIALAIVDMMMPGLDGAATMRHLRELNPEARLIAMSGMLENSSFGPGSGLEGVELLRKPITAEDLLTKIAAVLGREEAGRRRENRE
ncbi:hybrid sensor histidine kinase/response regulator [Opitutaceae bacterium EW11]|nr:hybrid sensor histidine kinase/response regulator [Opitutaceae bacterium EW11]